MNTEQMILTLAPGTMRRIRQEAANREESQSEIAEELILEALRHRELRGVLAD